MRSMKTATVWIMDGAFALYFVPTVGHLAAQVSHPPRICHPRQKRWLHRHHKGSVNSKCTHTPKSICQVLKPTLALQL